MSSRAIVPYDFYMMRTNGGQCPEKMDNPKICIWCGCEFDDKKGYEVCPDCFEPCELCGEPREPGDVICEGCRKENDPIELKAMGY
jgi:hypothetical protein